ncbi:unnamed protein product, partial [Rotaria magnacalcarata]
MMTYRTNELNAIPNEEFSIGIQSITYNYVDRNLAGTTSKLVNRVETHQTFIKQQRKYRRDGEIFPQTVEYNSQNLLGIYDAGNYGR